MSYTPPLRQLLTPHRHDLGDGLLLTLTHVDAKGMTGCATCELWNGKFISADTLNLARSSDRDSFFAAALIQAPDIRQRRPALLNALTNLGRWVMDRPAEAEVAPETPAVEPAPRIVPVIQSAGALMARRFAPLQPIIERLLLEGVTLFAGRPKLGKSWLILSCGLAVAIGGRALGQLAVRQGDVLYLALEDGDRRLQRRLIHILGEGAGIPERFYCSTQWPRLDAGGLEEIEGWIERATDPRLIIVDTMARLKAPNRVNRSLYDEDYSALAPLTDLVREHPGLCLVLVTHTRKMESDDPLDLISGSTGITGSVDGAIVLKRARGSDNGSFEASLHVFHRDADEDEEMALRRDPHIRGWALVGDAKEAAISPERRAILAALRSSDSPLGPTIIARATWDGDGEPDKKHAGVIRQLLGRMVDDGQILKTGRGGYLPLTTRSHRSHRSHSPDLSTKSEEECDFDHENPVTSVTFEPGEGAGNVTDVTDWLDRKSHSQADSEHDVTDVTDVTGVVEDDEWEPM